MGRFIYVHHDWKRNDALMQCYNCKAFIYSRYQNGHTKICGVDIEKDRQEAARSGREEAKGNAENKPTVKGSDQATAESTNSNRRTCYPASRRTGESGCGGNCTKDCAREAEASISLWNV